MQEYYLLGQLALKPIKLSRVLSAWQAVFKAYDLSHLKTAEHKVKAYKIMQDIYWQC